MKKFLLITITLLSILLLSCTLDDADIIENIDKKFNENIGYEARFEMTIFNDSKETIYKMREKYVHHDIISLEILEPSESSGITIEYKDDKIFLNHATIRQSITLKTVKDFDKGILLISFFENLDAVNSIDRQEFDGEDYYIIEYSSDEENRYNNRRYIFLDKKKLEPYKMEIMDEDGNTRVSITYEEFNYKR